ncbi:MAG: hypothetical protein HY323_08625 [Betaproteobacteria bacterium]|nr:hypothetical protein [Betaproteobacteria bacterium]
MGAFLYPEVVPFAHARLEAASDRAGWGTGRRHAMVKGATPSYGDLADLLSDWTPDAGLRERVLAQRPARLYDLA